MQNCLKKRSLVIAVIITALFVAQAFGASFVTANDGLDRPPIPPHMEANIPPEDPEPVCNNDPPLLISGFVTGPDGAVPGAVVIAKSNQSVNTTLTDEFGQYNLELGFNYSDYNGTEVEVSAYKGKLGATVSGIAIWPSITLDVELSERGIPLPEPIVALPEPPEPILPPPLPIPSSIPRIYPSPIEEPYNITLVTMRSPTGPLFESERRPIQVVLRNKADHNIFNINVDIYDRLDDSEPVFLTGLFYGCIPAGKEQTKTFTWEPEAGLHELRLEISYVDNNILQLNEEDFGFSVLTKLPITESDDGQPPHNTYPGDPTLMWYVDGPTIIQDNILILDDGNPENLPLYYHQNDIIVRAGGSLTFEGTDPGSTAVFEIVCPTAGKYGITVEDQGELIISGNSELRAQQSDLSYNFVVETGGKLTIQGDSDTVRSTVRWTHGDEANALAPGGIQLQPDSEAFIQYANILFGKSHNIYADGANVIIKDTIISGTQAPDLGSGIYSLNGAQVTIDGGYIENMGYAGIYCDGSGVDAQTDITNSGVVGVEIENAIGVAGPTPFTVGSEVGYFMWADIDGWWHIRWTSDGVPHTFEGFLRSDRFTDFEQVNWLEDFSFGATTIWFQDTESIDMDGINFKLLGTEVEFELYIDGVLATASTYIGKWRRNPDTMPFTRYLTQFSGSLTNCLERGIAIYDSEDVLIENSAIDLCNYGIDVQSTNGVAMKDVTVLDSVTDGAFIWQSSNIDFDYCNISDTANYAGIVFSETSSVVLTRSSFWANRIYGVIVKDTSSYIDLIECEIGLHTYVEMYVTGSSDVQLQNSNVYMGWNQFGVVVVGGHMDLLGSTIHGRDMGSGLWVDNAQKAVLIEDVTIKNCYEYGIYSQYSSLLISSSTIINNWDGIHVVSSDLEINDYTVVSDNLNDGVWSNLASVTLFKSEVSRNGGYGIHSINGVTYCEACDILENKESGILFQGGVHSDIVNCRIEENANYGIHLSLNKGTDINLCTITNNGVAGLFLDSSIKADVQNNRFWTTFGTIGLYVDGTHEGHFIHTVTSDNYVNKNPVYYYHSLDGGIIDLRGATVGHLTIAASSNLQVRRTTVMDGDFICVAYCNDITISTVSTSHSFYGIHVRDSTGINTIQVSFYDSASACGYIRNTHNSDFGVTTAQSNSDGFLIEQCSNVILQSNHNLLETPGNVVISILSSDKITVESTYIPNSAIGVLVSSSNNVHVQNSEFLDNGVSIYDDSSTYTIVEKDDFTLSSGFSGISLYDSNTIITDCNLNGPILGIGGHGIYAVNALPTVKSCTFTNLEAGINVVDAKHVHTTNLIPNIGSYHEERFIGERSAEVTQLTLPGNAEVLDATVTVGGLLMKNFPITLTCERQYSPAIYDKILVWDERRYSHWDVFAYDLEMDTDGDGVPNYLDYPRLDPDPAFTRITYDPDLQGEPDIYKDTIVWSDLRNGNWDIYAYTFSNDTEWEVVVHPAQQRYPAIDGDRIVWSDNRNGDNDIFMRNITTGEITQISGITLENDENPAIHNDKVVWYSWTGGPGSEKADIFLFDVNTWTQEQLTKDDPLQYLPTIHDNYVTWHDDRHGNCEIYLYDIATSSETRITNSAEGDFAADVYKDSITWYSHDGAANTWSVYLYDIPTGAQTVIEENTKNAAFPVVCDTRVAYRNSTGCPAGRSNIFVYDSRYVGYPTNPELLIGSDIAWSMTGEYTGLTQVSFKDVLNQQSSAHQHDLVWSTPLILTSDSPGTLLLQNFLLTYYSPVRVIESTFQGIQYGFRADNSDAIIENCTFEATVNTIMEVGAEGTSIVTLLNTTHDAGAPYVYVEPSSMAEIHVKWFMHVHVVHPNLDPIDYAEVNVFDLYDTPVLQQGMTDSEGMIRWIKCVDLIYTATQVSIYTPHNVSATKWSLQGWAKPEPYMKRSLDVYVVLGGNGYNIYLDTGWRLISIPYKPYPPLDTDPENIWGVLATIDGSWDAAEYYDGLTKEWWVTIVGQPPSIQEFLFIDHRIGFWIHITSDCTLCITGTIETSTTIDLYEEWNLVGYPASDDSSYTVAELKADTGATSVEGFDETAPYRISPLEDTYILKKTEGYWVKVPTTTTWTVDW